jgi:hypothetical protein
MNIGDCYAKINQERLVHYAHESRAKGGLGDAAFICLRLFSHLPVFVRQGFRTNRVPVGMPSQAEEGLCIIITILMIEISQYEST